MFLRCGTDGADMRRGESHDRLEPINPIAFGNKFREISLDPLFTILGLIDFRVTCIGLGPLHLPYFVSDFLPALDNGR
jgi:hypothetical protein